MAIISLDNLPKGQTKSFIPLEQLSGGSPSTPPAESGIADSEPARVLNQILRGPIHAATFPLDVIAAGTDYINKKLGNEALFKMSPSEAIDKLLLSDYAPGHPQTEAGKAIGNVGEIAAATATLGPGAALKKNLLTGLGSGVGSELLGRVDSSDPLWRVLGGILGQTLVGVGSVLLPSRKDIAEEVMSNVRPADLEQTVSKMEQARVDKLPINASQGMPRPSNLNSATELMASSRHGKNTSNILWDQPLALEEAVGTEIATLPGQTWDRQNLANRAQKAATELLDDVKKFRTAKVDADYKNVPKIDERFTRNLVQVVDGLLRRPGTAQAVKDDLVALRGRLVRERVVETPGSAILNAQGRPSVAPGKAIVREYETDPRNIKQYINETVGNTQFNMLNPKDPTTRGQMKYATKLLFNSLGNASNELRNANAKFRSITENLVNPLKKSVIGTLAGRQGAQEDKNAALKSLLNVFEEGTLPGQRVSQIRAAATYFNKKDPTIFQDTGKYYFRNKFDSIISGRNPQDPGNVAKTIVDTFGSPNPSAGGTHTRDWQTTLDILSGMGLNSNQIRGFTKLLNSASQMQIRPSSIRGASASELHNTLQNNVLSRIGAINFMTPLRQPALFAARTMESSILKDVDRWITTPEGLREMARLGQQVPGSPAWTKSTNRLWQFVTKKVGESLPTARRLTPLGIAAEQTEVPEN